MPAQPLPLRALLAAPHLARAVLRAGFRSLVDVVYPPGCMACRGATAMAGALCPSCWAAMRIIERPYCERLGTPFALDLGEGLVSPEAMADPPVFERARAVALYEGVARRLVHRLKFHDRLELADGMGRLMARAGAELLAESDVIVPVPLHWRRALQRRFNQAAALAAVVSRQSGLPWDGEALVRTRATHTQVGLSRTQRRENLSGAFAVTPEGKMRLAGLRVLLVDDVLTSGATANAAARVLLRAGAGPISVVSFARVASDA